MLTHTLIHGDNNLIGYQILTATLSSYSKTHTILRISKPNLALDEIIQIAEGESLVSGPRVLNILDLHTLSQKARQSITQYLYTAKHTLPIVVYIPKQLTKSQLKDFSNFKILEAKPDKSMFLLFESLGVKPSKNIQQLFRQTIHTTPYPVVITLLLRHIRQLLTVSEHQFKGPSWLQAKLSRQLNTIGPKTLLALHQRLYRLEADHRQSQSVIKPETLLENILVSL